MKRSSLFAASLACLMLASTPSFAAKLSAGAKKVSATELKKIYSGKSVFWSKTVGYFKPDGSFYARKKNNSLFVIGKWRVSKGKMCRSGKWYNLKTGKKGSFSNNCMLWMKDGGKLWTVDAGDKGNGSDWSNKETSKLKAGDSVSKKLLKMKKTYDAKF
ncbi:MAG: DUF995 domain-containing protein [Cohaesibacter sp.]|jgi:hypothetical protein|nr:DUF995 domain-containing protein [Cohaesibacter sp.]